MSAVTVKKQKEGKRMAINSFAEFGEMQRSVLQEICNMGAGNAATAISQMISSPTDISTPQVKVLSTVEAGKITDLLSSRTEAYLITLCGDLKGSVLFLFPYAFIERLVSGFFPGATITKRDDIDEMAASVIRETVNIAAATYANNLAIMSGMMVDISVPQNVKKPSANIFSVNAPGTMHVCFINTSLEVTDCHKAFNILFFPELETIKDFMGRIGVQC